MRLNTPIDLKWFYTAVTDKELLDYRASVANALVTKLNQVLCPGPVTDAVTLLLGRIVGAGNSLRTLQEHAPHNFAFDGAMILRGIYDAMLQALYILADQTKRDDRAQLYLDFFWIEKQKAIQSYDKSPTHLGERISNSTLRAKTEPLINREIQRVRPKFLNRKGKPRNHWYEGDLRDLAREAGLETEYELFQKHFSGFVHSSPYALKEGMPVDGFLLLTFGWQFAFRVLGRLAEFVGVTLDQHESALVRIAEGNVFDPPTQPSIR